MVVDGYSIFQHTRAAISAAKYPSALEYTIAVSGDDGDTPRTDHYSAFYSQDDGKVFVNAISSEEAAHPVTSHGANLHITFRISFNAAAGGKTATATTKTVNPEASADLVGVPLLSPTYMFGMHYESVASPAILSGPSSLRTIAVVDVGKPAYSVALSGTAMLNGAETYELNLTPLRDPKANRLRTLWVGVNDYLPRKAIVAGNFTEAPLVDVSWTIEFSAANGVPLIADESSNQTLFMPHHHVVRDASITFENVRQADDTALLQRQLLQQPPTSATLIEP